MSTPLCPAGHLPRKGGNSRSSVISLAADGVGRAAKLPISLLEWEMSGKTGGGATERGVR
ncbi:lytic murein transglycosylase [Mesorhizobium sp. WSM3866]|nr:lytic murein transglycosylase [Mesorhizobium sp. WSM3866]